ncbi:MAG: adenosine deaminase, partial [Rhizobiales bacterium]|nr:adenosine deaminase [Hyphomicrobiales bacterium]
MTGRMPKAELHCHIEGATPPALALAQAKRYGIDTSRFIREGQYAWEDFTSFVESYDATANLFRTEEDYALLAETYLTGIAQAGAIYSELIVSPDQGDAVGIGADAYISGLAEGAQRARAKTGIETRFLVVGIRHFGPERVVKAAEYAARRPHPLVTGFNLAGEERIYRVADFARAFDIARDAGLGITIHAGELSGAFSVRDAL